MDKTLQWDESQAILKLQHAVEILAIAGEGERSIGPDLPPWSEKQQQEQQKPRELQKVVADETPAPVPMPAITRKSILQLMDYNTLTASVLHREYEKRRRRLIREQMLDIHRHSAESASLTGPPDDDDESQRWLEQRRCNEQLILQQAERIAAEELESNTRQLAELRSHVQRQLHIMAFQGVAIYQSKFRTRYEMVAQLLLNVGQGALPSSGTYNGRLKELVQNFEKLIHKIKSNACGAADLRTAETLCQSLDALEESLLTELQNSLKRVQQQAKDAEAAEAAVQKQQAAAAAAAEEEKAAAEAEQEKAAAAAVAEQQKQEANAAVQPLNQAESQPASETTTTDSAGGLPPHAVSIFAFYHEKVEKIKPLQTEEGYKRYRFACQKAINIPLNAISAVSPQHLQDKYDKLHSFISGQPLKTSDGQVSVNDHPLGRDYCVLLMAKKFVSQGDTAISSNAQAAFPVASVIVSLWKVVPDFGQAFLAYIYKESPFLVPYIPSKKDDQSLEEYYKVLGYRVSGDNVVEQQDQYLKRQAGIARLYAAVLITSGRRADGPAHPYGIEHGWRWLAYFIKLEPLPDISATLIVEMLQAIGADLFATYGKQFYKLLLCIHFQYMPKLAVVDEGGPKARLELLLQKILKEGQVPRSSGTLPPGFW